jgi:hypothetical protein
VAFDGTKLRASARRRKAMSYDHIDPRLEQLQAQVRALLAQAEMKDRARTAATGSRTEAIRCLRSCGVAKAGSPS